MPLKGGEKLGREDGGFRRHGAVRVAILSGLIKLASRRGHLCEDLKNVRAFTRGLLGGARARQAVARQDNSRKPVWQEPRRGRVVEMRSELRPGRGV